jgi:hypothetical protein
VANGFSFVPGFASLPSELTKNSAVQSGAVVARLHATRTMTEKRFMAANPAANNPMRQTSLHFP